jgi:hypothetical protein
MLTRRELGIEEEKREKAERDSAQVRQGCRRRGKEEFKHSHSVAFLEGSGGPIWGRGKEPSGGGIRGFLPRTP